MRILFPSTTPLSIRQPKKNTGSRMRLPSGAREYRFTLLHEGLVALFVIAALKARLYQSLRTRGFTVILYETTLLLKERLQDPIHFLRLLLEEGVPRAFHDV